MAVKVAINGFRTYWTSCIQTDVRRRGYEVVAINDLTSPKMLAHLLKYD
ncbi:Glyceraldehyde-3-phosphate dehydrogenase/erythrose-4-phosphate dehydrogenase, partial [human gut metagenome]